MDGSDSGRKEQRVYREMSISWGDKMLDKLNSDQTQNGYGYLC